MSKRAIALLLATVTAVAGTSQQAIGQTAGGASSPKKPAEYTEFPVNPNFKPIDPAIVASNPAAAAADSKRTKARNAAYNNARKVMARQIPADDAGKLLLDEWYKKYYLPSFTLPENRGKLPEMRHALLSKDFRTARSPEAVAYLRTQVLNYMKGYAQNAGKYNFHPAVRYNAMLVIGSLNQVEHGARYPDDSRAFVPDPLPAALDLLIAEFKSPTQIDAVLVAALVGIDRHVKLDLARPPERRIPGPKKKVIVDAMVALLNSPPPTGRTASGHAWMQRRAIDILAAQGMVGVYAQADAALETIVADKDAPISLRCTASEALARWAPTSKEKIDASAVSRNLGLIAVKACTDELDRIAALLKQEEVMEQLRELIKKPNPVATGQFGTSAAGGNRYGSGENMYGSDDSGDDEETEMDSQYGANMYGGGREMYGGGGLPGAEGAVATDPRIDWSRRRLKYQLTCVKHGLDGMAIAGKASQHEKVVSQVATAVDLALDLTDPPEEKPNLEGLTESIQKGLRGLAFLVPKAADPLTELPESPIDDLAPTPEAASPAEPAAVVIDPADPPAAEGDALQDLSAGEE